MGNDSLVPLMHHDPSNLGLTRLVKKRKIPFGIYLSCILLKMPSFFSQSPLVAGLFFRLSPLTESQEQATRPKDFHTADASLTYLK